MKVIDKLIINDKPPEYKTVVWIDTSDNYISKIWDSGEWRSISGIINPDGSSIIPYDDIPNLDSITGSAGNSFKYSRGDHRHPSDTSKVDKVNGKGLSTYDYDATAKAKVDAIPANPQYTDTIYDDTVLEGRISVIEGKLSGWDAKQETLVSGTNIKTINNLSILGEGNLTISGGGGGEENIIESISVNSTPQTIDNNKNVDITVPTKTSDLNNDSGFITGYIETDPTVPSWAKQSSKPSYDYSEIGNTPTIPTVPTNVSAFNNDAGYLTQHQDLSNYVLKSNTAGLLKNDGTVDTNTYITSAHEVPSGGNAGQILKKVSATDYDITWANQSETLPSAYCTTSGSTAAKRANCSLYVAQANQYLQVLIGSPNTYQGALTLNINSAGDKPIYINGTISSSSNYTLPNGTYFVFYDGTNYYFRTDGKIQGPDGILYNIPSTGIPASDLASGVIPDISGKADKTLVASSMPSGGFLPNVVYNLGALSGNTTFSMAAATDNTIANIWCWTFTTPSTAPTITWPAGITEWVGGFTPTINASKSYEITVMNGFATIIES